MLPSNGCLSWAPLNVFLYWLSIRRQTWVHLGVTLGLTHRVSLLLVGVKNVDRCSIFDDEIGRFKRCPMKCAWKLGYWKTENLLKICGVNSLWHNNAATWRHWIESTLAQVMTSYLTATKPLPGPMLSYNQSGPVPSKGNHARDTSAINY